MLRFAKPIWTVLKTTTNNYLNDRILHMGAALAYYTIFSLPALIIIVVGLVGFFFGEAAIRGQIALYLQEIVSASTAAQIEAAVRGIGSPRESWWATMLGLGFLGFVATGIFYGLQEALNTIFRVQATEPPSSGILQTVVNRLLAFAMILLMSAVLILSILLNAVLGKLSGLIATYEPQILESLPSWLEFSRPYIHYFTDYFLRLMNQLLSLFLLTLFFALSYKILPAVRLSWRYCWAGALFAATLFWVGQMLIGIYLGSAGIISAYGAAGSIIALLVWVYYSTQLVFLGAEFIKALCAYRGVAIHPKPFAKTVISEEISREWVAPVAEAEPVVPVEPTPTEPSPEEKKEL